jgi:hypothetical protein
MGRTNVEDALERLDVLTKEETLMVSARTLEVAHHVDGNAAEIKDTVHDVDENIKETKVLTRNIGEDVKVIEEVARDIDHNVKATQRGMQRFPSAFITYRRILLALFQTSNGCTPKFVTLRHFHHYQI